MLKEKVYKAGVIGKLFRWLPLVLIAMLPLGHAHAQTDTLFWFGAPDVTRGHSTGGDETFLILTNPSNVCDAHVTVTQPASVHANRLNEVITVPKGSSRMIDVFRDMATYEATVENDIEDNDGAIDGILNRGILIRSDSMITATYSIETNNNPDIWALKGQNAMGDTFYLPLPKHELWYNHPKYNPDPANGFIITATEDNTTVTILPTEDIWDAGNPLEFNPVPSHTAAGGAYTIVLNKGQSYVGMGHRDGDRHPAGTRITSDKPVVVDMFDDSVDRGNNRCKDLIGDQLVPVQLTGTEYIVWKGKLALDPDGNYCPDCSPPGCTCNHEDYGIGRDLAFIYATEDNTEVYINRPDVPGNPDSTIYIDEQEVGRVDIQDNDWMHITSNKRVYVTHVSGHGCEMGGAILPSLSSCTGSEVVGFKRINDARSFYLFIMTKADAVDNFFFDGADANPLIPPGDFQTIPGSDWVFFLGEFDDTQISQNNPTRIENISPDCNTDNLFHLGFLNGNYGGGNTYGYFSNYKSLDLESWVVETGGTEYVICYNDSANLYAQGGICQEWTPNYNISSTTDANVTVWPEQTFTYTVSVIGHCGMTAEEDLTVYVDEPLAAEFSVDRVEGCTPLRVNITNNSYGEQENRWYFSDVNPPGYTLTMPAQQTLSKDFSNAGNVPVEYEIKLRAISDISYCQDSAVRYINVYPSPAAFFLPDDDEGCSPHAVNFTNFDLSPPGEDYSYTWEFADGDVRTEFEPSHTFYNTSPTSHNYNVSLTARNIYNCYGNWEDIVTVHPQVEADFTRDIQGNCQPLEATFNNISVNADRWVWDFDDGSPPVEVFNTDPVYHTFTNAGPGVVYRTVTLFAEHQASGCNHTVEKVIPVYPEITASFTATPTSGCAPLTVQFEETTTGTYTLLSWDFGDGFHSNATDPVHTFNYRGSTDTTYYVSLELMNGEYCTDTMVMPITVRPEVIANFTYNFDDNCSPLDITFDNASSTGQTYIWVFDPGSGDSTVVGDYSSQNRVFTNVSGSPETHTAKLYVTATTGCVDSVEKSFEVVMQPTANFAPDVTQGCNPLEVTFTNILEADVDYFWEYGDTKSSGTDDAVHSHTFHNYDDNEQTYTVTMTATAGDYCTDKATANITVYPYLEASFYDDGTPGCSPYRANFINNSSTSATSFLWEFGDATQLTKAVPTPTPHTYTDITPGTDIYTVSLTAYNGPGDICTDMATRQVRVYPQVTAGFTVTPTNGCEPLYATFTNTSSATASTYLWEFDDGGTSISEDTEHLFANNTLAVKNYTVSLTAYSSEYCSDQATQTISVQPAINPEFSFNAGISCSPYEIDFRNLSYGGQYFMWSFGDTDSLWQGGKSDAIHLYDNNTGSTQQYKVTLISTNADSSCIDSVTHYVSTYPSIDAGFTPGDTTGCGPLSIDFTDTSSAAVTSWLWDFGDGAYSTQQNPTHVFDNLTNSPVTYTVSLTAASSDNCKDGASIDVTLAPYLQTEFYTARGFVCSPDTISFFNTTVGGNKYLWRFSQDPTDTLTVFDETPITRTYTNSTGSTQFVTVTLIGWSNAGCVDSVKHVLEVHPEIEAGFTVLPDTFGCAPLEISFTDNSTGSASWQWDFGDGGLSNQQNPVHTFTNYTSSDIIYTVRQTAISAENCQSVDSAQILVRPNLQTAIVADQTTGCNILSVTLEDISPGADSVRWVFGDGDTAWTLKGAQLVHDYENTTSQPDTSILRVYSYNSATGCEDSLSQDIIVYPPIDVNILNNLSSVCAPTSITFDTVNTVGASSFQWDFGDGSYSTTPTLSHVYDNYSGTDTTFIARLIATSPYMCNDTDSVHIRVYPRVEALANLSGTFGCAPQLIDVENLSVGATQYEWAFSHNPALDFTTANTAPFTLTYTNTGATPDTNQITLIATSTIGCTDTLVQNVIIWPEVRASFSATANACSNEDVSFTDLSTGSPTNWLWAFGDGSNSLQQNPTHQFDNDASADQQYYVTLTAKSGYNCTDDTTISINIYPDVIPDFGIAYQNDCAPFSPDSIVNHTQNATRYLWHFGRNVDDTLTTFNRDPLTGIVFPGNAGGVTSYTISLTATNATNGCSDSLLNRINVYPPVTADFSITQPDSCASTAVSFTNNSTNGVYYQWHFGDFSSSAETDPAHTYFNPSYSSSNTYYVSLVATSSEYCRDTTTKPVYIHPQIDAQLSISSAFGCSPFAPTIYVDNNTGFDQLRLEYGDGFFTTGISPSYIHTYSNPGTTDSVNTIKLLVTNTATGCADSANLDVTTYPQVRASMSYTPQDTACHNQIVSFDTTGTENASSFIWAFGDGASSVSNQPDHLFKNNSTVNDTTYTVSLTASSDKGCRDVATQDIVILQGVDANFGLSLSGGCAPLVTRINDNSQGGSNYYWDFDDGNTLDTTARLSNSDYSFGSPGTYSLSLTVTNEVGCTDQMTRDIEVLEQAYARFITPDPMQGCHPVNINFTNSSYPVTVTSQWEFGDGSSTSAASPGHTFRNLNPDNTASYYVTLTVFNSMGSYQCIDDTVARVDVYPVPEASFSLDSSDLCSPALVPISNYALGADGSPAYEWDFDGDGIYESNTSLANFTQTYNNTTGAPIDYDITLKVNGNEGCADSLTRTIRIYPEVIVDVQPFTGSGCSPLSINFTDNSSNVGANGTYTWLFSDDTTQVHTANTSHTFYHYGSSDTTFNAMHIATNIAGCADTLISPVTVRGQPVANYSIPSDTICAPYNLQFTDQSAGADNYSWTFGDGNSDNIASPGHEYINLSDEPIRYEAFLQVTNSNGCHDNYKRMIYVMPMPTASFIRTDLDCWPLEVRFDAQNDTAAYFNQWAFGDGDSAQGGGPIHIYSNYSGSPRTDTVRLVATSKYQCSATYSMPVYLENMPRAAFTATPEEQTWPSNQVSIDNQSTAGPWNYSWTMGDGSSSTDEEPGQHSYNSPGRYTIELALSDSTGLCTDIAQNDIIINYLELNAFYEIEGNEGCPPLTVTFNNTSSFRDSSIWNFGTGPQTINDTEVSYTFHESGDYVVSLEIWGAGKKDVYLDTVHVWDEPNIDFYTTPDPPIVSATIGTIEFTNNTTNGADFLWLFGDGDSSTVANPSHDYADEGQYDVTLIAVSSQGCPDTLSREDYVTIESPCYLEFPNAFTPGWDNVSGEYDQADELNDPEMYNNIFHPRHDGVMEYELVIYNRWGEIVFESNDVNYGWNGFYRTDRAKQDVYVWKVNAKCYNGRRIIRAGDVILLR